jgi:hypothetical protein
MHRKGFSLRQMFIVISILCMLLGLVLPAINSAREDARRMTCAGHVKQLTLALQNYHDIFFYLPYGARERTTVPRGNAASTFGGSWLIATTPFMESSPLFDNVCRADWAGSDYASTGILAAAHNHEIKLMLCPSSPLPEMETIGNFSLVLPSYAGIMGAGTDTIGPDQVIDRFDRIVSGPYGGLAAANGMLLLNETMAFAGCTDGTANTIFVGEVSDWYYSDAGLRFNPALATVDAGTGRKSTGGWLAGTDLNFKVEKDGEPVPADRVFNIITVNHPIGINNYYGKKDSHPNWGTAGIGRCGLNNPLLSAHPMGAMVGFADGQVRMLTKQTSLHVLKRLAQRDDGGKLPEDF